jgi:cytochrome c-type biogenesis protein CcmH
VVIAVIVRRRRAQRADTPQSLSTEERQRLDQLLDKNQE